MPEESPREVDAPFEVETIALPSGQVLAIVIRHGRIEDGIHFVTPSDFSQQVGLMRHPGGYIVAPHRHNEVDRSINRTQEVLLVREGSCDLDLYSDDEAFWVTVRLRAGDVVVLASGGHGIRFLEDSELIEVKQGPFVGEFDKTRFPGRNDG